MRQIVVLAIDLHNQVPYLAERIAGRAYNIQGVKDARVLKDEPLTTEQLEAAGFSLSEISLGSQEVERG